MFQANLKKDQSYLRGSPWIMISRRGRNVEGKKGQSRRFIPFSLFAWSVFASLGLQWNHQRERTDTKIKQNKTEKIFYEDWNNMEENGYNLEIYSTK